MSVPSSLARRAILVAGALSGALVPVASASADPLPVPPSVARAIAEVRRAEGPEAYAALRGLWRQWDQTDPAHVESMLADVAGDGARPAPVRAYAGLLVAYGRRRRGDLDGARARVRGLGFVDRWIAVGPFDDDGRAGFSHAYGPEEDLAEPLQLAKWYEAKERPARWRVVPDAYGYGWLDLGDLVRPQERVCAYATTFVRSKKGAARPASVWIGASGAFRAFWNGAEVLADGSYRQLDADRLATRVALAKGWNRLTVKVCGDESSPMLSVRLADAAGAPDADLEASADLGAAQEAASHAVAKKTEKQATGIRVLELTPAKPAKDAPKQALPAGTGIEGPVQALRRRATKDAPAAASEAFARYLASTGGDDPTEHLARDLARRAAEQEPTVARLLLAGELAADRNQRREWVGKARKLAGAHPSVAVLLAEAQLARTGPNWRDAIPFYDEVLAIEPGNVAALLGRVELYDEAGLKRTALLTLEDAVRDNPMSVALLRIYADQLRHVGRATEAAEAEERYASLRFDDGGWIADRIDVAVARRDEKGAARWIDRMLATDPDSAWALGVAARAWRSLGQEQRAVASYQRALELAPEDVDTLRAQADLYGEKGQRDEQLAVMRQILQLRPQAKDVREYVEHIEPPKARADESLAWSADRFLPFRSEPAHGQNRRTLRDLQVTTVFPNGLASRFYQVVFQPMTDEAAASAREYAFAYQGDSQTVQLRAARVYRDGGKIDEAVESGEGPADSPELATYTSARTYWVHFPRLNAGDVVELLYRIDDVTPRNELADAFSEVVYLQSTEPVRQVEYVLRAPKSRAFRFGVSPLPGVVREESDDGDQHVVRIAAENVAPILPEPAMPPLAEVAAKVHVSTWSSWDDLARWYWGLARDQLDLDDEVRQLVAKLTGGLTEPADKVRAIYGWVVQRTRYVALEFGIYGYKPRRCSLTFARGWGDCKDKASLIVAMLREAGVPANMVLVRTGMRGDIAPEPPSLAAFDHAIAYVPSLDLFLDGTAEYTGSTELPAMDRGALALVVGEDGKGKLVHLPDPEPELTRRARRVEVILGPDGGAQIDLRVETSGALASEWRQRYHAKGTRRERLSRDLGGELPGFELAAGQNAIELNDLEDIEQPVRLRSRGRAPAFARRDGDDLSVAVGPSERLVPSYATLSTRAEDIRVRFRSSLEDELVIHVPTGMQVKSLPEPAKGDGPFGSWELAVDNVGNKVIVRTKLALRKSRIAPPEYAAFRTFCESVDHAFGQRLVLGGAK